MTVPLDRLYNFLDDIVNQDIIIYRWWPNGSKKLTDLTLLKLYKNLEIIVNPRVVCHDQEPLDYFLYSTDEILASLTERRLKFFPGWGQAQVMNYFLSSGYYKNYLQEYMGLANIYDQYILLHSEKNSNQISTYAQYGAIPVYYFAHALIALDWFRYAQIDPALAQKIITKDFLIYNRSWAGSREYRLKFSELVVTNHLSNQCQMNFSVVDNNINYKDHSFKNSKFKPDLNNIESYFYKNAADSNCSADYNFFDYRHCGIEVVLETLFDDNRLHLTEKIFRPIACGQPFILASTPYSLKYIREYGFKTFESVIDESYDLEQDPIRRLNKIILLMKNISNLSITEKDQLYSKLNAIAAYNKKQFFSKNFRQQIVGEYVQNMTIGLNQLRKFKGKNFLNLTKRREANNLPLYLSKDDQDTIINLIDS